MPMAIPKAGGSCWIEESHFNIFNGMFGFGASHSVGKKHHKTFTGRIDHWILEFFLNYPYFPTID